MRIDLPMGACCGVGGYGPWPFVRGGPDRLYVRQDYGGAVRWSNEGAPRAWDQDEDQELGTSISFALGVLSVFPAVFVRGGDGQAWMWSEPHYKAWRALGAPPSAAIVAPLGVIYGSFCYVFVRGSDGHMWLAQANEDGSSTSWIDQGAPPGVAIAGGLGVSEYSGVPESSPRTPSPIQAFVRGSDGHVWARVMDGDGKWSWNDVGAAPGASLAGGLGAASWFMNDNVHVFARDTDGQVWDRWSTGKGGKWVWNKLGTPPNVALSAGLGATAALGTTFVFIRGSDGHLWAYTYYGDEPVDKPRGWTDFGAPPNAAIQYGIGTVTNRPTYRDSGATVFVRGSDDHIWACAYGRWRDLGQPAD